MRLSVGVEDLSIIQTRWRKVWVRCNVSTSHDAERRVEGIGIERGPRSTLLRGNARPDALRPVTSPYGVTTQFARETVLATQRSFEDRNVSSGPAP